MRIRILEGHVNYPLLRGAGAGVFMLVGAAYDGRRSLFLGSPAAPLDGTQRRLIVPSLLSERASPKAPPPKKKSEKKKKKENSAHWRLKRCGVTSSARPCTERKRWP